MKPADWFAAEIAMRDKERLLRPERKRASRWLWPLAVLVLAIWAWVA